LKNTKIIVCYHKDSDIFENDVLLPLHVGKAQHLDVLPKMQGDNTGNNISHKNETYCELTGLYWLWKNIQADNYGLFHYRRFLDVNNKYPSQAYPEMLDLSDFNKSSFDNIMKKFDIVLPKKSNFKFNLYEHYKKDHIAKDLDIVIDIIKKDYPTFLSAAKKVMRSNRGYFSNMFIMKDKYFKEYCTWLFEILEKTEKLIDISEYDSYQRRVFGFLSERILSIYIQHKIDTDSNIKIKEVRRTFLNTNPLKKINFLIGSYIKYPDKNI